MLQILITALVPLFMLIVLMSPIRTNITVLLNLNQNRVSNLLSKDYTTTIKGLAAIVVILVHFSNEHTNALQDAIGSFGYVAVTFFFLVSSYGMIMALDRNESYLRHFIPNRLTSLLIPMVLANVVFFIGNGVVSDKIDFMLLTNINGYVMVLLGFCAAFYVTSLLSKAFRWPTTYVINLLIVIVAISSLAFYLFSYSDVSANSAWCFEQYGLIWGLLIYRYKQRLEIFLSDRRLLKAMVFIVLSILFGVMYLKFKFIYFWGEYLLKIVLGLVILLTLFIMTSEFKLGTRLQKFLGSISYEAYLLHGYVIIILSRVTNLPSGVFIVTAVALTIVLSTVIHAIDQPIVKRLRRQ